MKTPRLSLMDICYIGLGGMLGSLLRSWVGFGFEGDFPVPTMLVNILGACALAVLHATQHRIHAQGRYLYMVGFCGSFTTVSLFSYETLQLAQNGAFLQALLNILVPVICALALTVWIISRLDRREEASQ
ncbi:CrcB family protein [Puniceicoccales bacterium CK1056]|uniref:Fluoride-specific ion channel FluC n=1 Tax=Oceanipulchritudo coccoides TaxID=2706888 RepID=A0A6B2M1F6_9BACT|nr:CrcB family protein [Oceanipulchritudo coccoides]